MAHTIKLKYGSPASWSYIDLTDANHGNVSYYPQTPGQDAEEVTESGEWRVAGSSVSDLLAKIGEIENAFYKAGVYAQDEIGAYQVWVTIVPDGTGDTWESQIYEGRLELTENVLGVDWANKTTNVVLLWRRAGWWEKFTKLLCSNTNGDSQTNPVRVYNCADDSGAAPTKKQNWVDIGAGEVLGDLPAPATIAFVGAMSIKDFFVVCNARTSPTAVNLAEGEPGDSQVVDATRSGGKYGNYSVGTSGRDVETSATSLFTVIDGGWLRIFLSANFTGTISAQPYILVSGIKYYGPKSRITGITDWALYDLGLIRIPQIKTSFDGFSAGFTNIKVGMTLTASSSITVSVDYYQFIPMDAYARGVLDYPVGDLTVIDTRENSIFGNDNYPTAKELYSLGTLYGGVWLEPGMAQRLTFKLISTAMAGKLDVMSDYSNVYVYAWLRKRTL